MAFNNNVVIVTGASSGFGAAAAIRFAKEGANVVIVGRNKSKLSDVAEKCENNGNKPVVIVADLTTDSGAKETIDTTLANFGKLDVLVNNAGVCGTVDIIISDNVMEKFDAIMAINLRVVVHLTNLSAPHLIKSKGNIVNISSIGANGIFIPGNFAYCSSKAALDHFTRCVALDFARYGVRVNSISPGPAKTDCMDAFIPNKTLQDEYYNEITKATALGKLTTSEEVAELILYLTSDKSKSIIGSSFVIDNGMLLKG